MSRRVFLLVACGILAACDNGVRELYITSARTSYATAVELSPPQADGRRRAKLHFFFDRDQHNLGKPYRWLESDVLVDCQNSFFWTIAAVTRGADGSVVAQQTSTHAPGSPFKSNPDMMAVCNGGASVKPVRVSLRRFYQGYLNLLAKRQATAAKVS